MDNGGVTVIKMRKVIEKNIEFVWKPKCKVDSLNSEQAFCSIQLKTCSEFSE